MPDGNSQAAWLQAASSLGTAGIGAAASIFGNERNIREQRRVNAEDKAWQEKMYGLQRQHALEDYFMQNEYNHPSSQMARLRQAGLNPALVYGKGASQMAESIRPATPGSYSPQAGRVDYTAGAQAVAQGISTYQDVILKEAQIDNLRNLNTGKGIENLIKLLDLDIKGVDARFKDVMTQGKFDLLINQIANLSQDTDNKKAALPGIEASSAVRQEELDIIRQTKGTTVQMVAERLLGQQLQNAKSDAERQEIEQRIKNLALDQRMKQLDVQLAEFGLRPTDELWQRLTAIALKKFGIPTIR